MFKSYFLPGTSDRVAAPYWLHALIHVLPWVSCIPLATCWSLYFLSSMALLFDKFELVNKNKWVSVTCAFSRQLVDELAVWPYWRNVACVIFRDAIKMRLWARFFLDAFCNAVFLAEVLQ